MDRTQEQAAAPQPTPTPTPSDPPQPSMAEYRDGIADLTDMVTKHLGREL